MYIRKSQVYHRFQTKQQRKCPPLHVLKNCLQFISIYYFFLFKQTTAGCNLIYATLCATLKPLSKKIAVQFNPELAQNHYKDTILVFILITKYQSSKYSNSRIINKFNAKISARIIQVKVIIRIQFSNLNEWVEITLIVKYIKR